MSISYAGYVFSVTVLESKLSSPAEKKRDIEEMLEIVSHLHSYYHKRLDPNWKINKEREQCQIIAEAENALMQITDEIEKAPSKIKEMEDHRRLFSAQLIALQHGRKIAQLLKLQKQILKEK